MRQRTMNNEAVHLFEEDAKVGARSFEELSFILQFHHRGRCVARLADVDERAWHLPRTRAAVQLEALIYLRGKLVVSRLAGGKETATGWPGAENDLRSSAPAVGKSRLTTAMVMTERFVPSVRNHH
eukprot:6184633-Pleurochrysis_carterae.AAC.4